MIVPRSFNATAALIAFTVFSGYLFI